MGAAGSRQEREVKLGAVAQLARQPSNRVTPLSLDSRSPRSPTESPAVARPVLRPELAGGSSPTSSVSTVAVERLDSLSHTGELDEELEALASQYMQTTSHSWNGGGKGAHAADVAHGPPPAQPTATAMRKQPLAHQAHAGLPLPTGAGASDCRAGAGVHAAPSYGPSGGGGGGRGASSSSTHAPNGGAIDLRAHLSAHMCARPPIRARVPPRSDGQCDSPTPLVSPRTDGCAARADRSPPRPPPPTPPLPHACSCPHATLAPLPTRRSATAEEPAAGPPVGATISWQRGQMLGSGSFGRVYFGLNTVSGELMAVKQIKYTPGQHTE
jgi:hypothetical protein